MSNAAQLRETMIASQLRPSRASDPQLIAAFRQVPRELFVPADRQALAYADEDIAIAPGRVLLEPITIARLIGEARIQPGDRVLAIGGVGYGGAVMAALGATVVVVEADAQLAAAARLALDQAGTSGVSVVEGPLAFGHGAGAPYDVIVVEGAMAVIPQALIDQLTDGGRLCGLQLEGGVTRGVLGRKSGTAFGTRPFMDAFAPVLPGFEQPQAFRF